MASVAGSFFKIGEKGMAIKIGINGFGRIGRLVFRAAMQNKNVEVVGINDLFDSTQLAYMLKYDTIHGKFDGTVEAGDGCLVVNGKKIRLTAERNVADLKWGDVSADYVCESTGVITSCSIHYTKLYEREPVSI